MRHRWTPEAREDLFDSAEYYESQRRGLGSEFSVQLGLGLAQILEAPQRWPEIEPGYRKYRIDPFPLALVYRIVTSDLIEITAVFNLRRQPGTWRRS
jgi:plasmid stabilization system protein ParE